MKEERERKREREGREKEERKETDGEVYSEHACEYALQLWGKEKSMYVVLQAKAKAKERTNGG